MMIQVAPGHFVQGNSVVSVLPAHTRPAILLREGARKENRVINLKGGTVKIKSMIVMDSNMVVLVSMPPQKFAQLVNLSEGQGSKLPVPRRGVSFFDSDDVEDSDISLEGHVSEKFPELGEKF